MMDLAARIALLVTGATPERGAARLDERLEALAVYSDGFEEAQVVLGFEEAQVVLGEDLVWCGSVQALAETYPERFNGLFWRGRWLLRSLSEGRLDASMLTLALTCGDPEPTAAWNDFYLARWAEVGAAADLKELVRRAKHRDGSTDSLVASIEAVSLLSEGLRLHPGILAGSLKAAGYTEPLQHGVFAVGRVKPSPPGPVFRSAIVPTLVQAPAPVVRPVPPVAEEGTVFICGSFYPITQAIALSLSVTAAVRKLLLPAEGYVWIDDTLDPLRASSLVLLDILAGEGLGLPEFTGPGGGLLAGQVTQNPDTAKYTCVVYDSTGSNPFGGLDDQNAAKFKVAERVRAVLK